MKSAPVGEHETRSRREVAVSAQAGGRGAQAVRPGASNVHPTTRKRRPASSPANSTPVGPPPTTTTCSMRSRSRGERPGMLALLQQATSSERMTVECAASLRHDGGLSGWAGGVKMADGGRQEQGKAWHSMAQHAAQRVVHRERTAGSACTFRRPGCQRWSPASRWRWPGGHTRRRNEARPLRIGHRTVGGLISE